MPNNQAKRTLIALAVNELAKDHEYDSITVDMICKRAGISRSGFYRSFEDKYAILTWCESFPLTLGLGQIGRTFDIKQGVKATIDGLGLFRDMFASTRRSTERYQREDNGIERAHQLFCETIVDYHKEALDTALDYQAFWAARGTMLAIRDQKDAEQDSGELAGLIAECYPSRLAAILNAPVDPAKDPSIDIKSFLLQQAWQR